MKFTILEVPHQTQLNEDKPDAVLPNNENPPVVYPNVENDMLIITKETNYKEINPNSNDNQSINHDRIDRIDLRESYHDYILESIDYESFVCDQQYDIDRIFELVDLMVDVNCSTNETVKINGAAIPQIVVKSQFLKLERKHIEYVLDSMEKASPEVQNIRSYILTALYNSPNTIENYYSAWVNHNTSKPNCL